MTRSQPVALHPSEASPVQGQGSAEEDARIADWAASGVVPLTGHRHRPPLVPPGDAAGLARRLQATFQTLLPRDGGSPLPSYDWRRLLGERAALRGLSRRGPWSPSGRTRALRTRDHWVVLTLARLTDVEAVSAITGTDCVIDDVREAWSRLAPWARSRSSDEVVERAGLLEVPCAAVPWSRARPAVGRRPVVENHANPGIPRPTTATPLVVNLSALWAGPLCAHLLGVAGARVVKVETTSRPDGARQGDPALFDLLHAGHDSVVVNVTDPADLRALRSLLDRADIVVDSSRPRGMRSLGIDPAAVLRDSETTWVSITAYGREHPQLVGFGDDVSMAAGLVAYEGPDRTPLPVGDAVADPLTGMHAAVAALRSFRAGGSRLLDVSMAACAAATLVEHGSPTSSVRRRGDAWVIETSSGELAVSPPTARPVTVRAARAGQHTQQWRHP